MDKKKTIGEVAALWKKDKQQYVKPQSGENEKIGHAKNDFIADFVCKGTKFFVSLQQILKNI